MLSVTLRMSLGLWADCITQWWGPHGISSQVGSPLLTLAKSDHSAKPLLPPSSLHASLLPFLPSIIIEKLSLIIRLYCLVFGNWVV